MKVTEKEFYKVLEDEGENLDGLISMLKEKQADFKNDNLIVDVLRYKKIKLKELVAFLAISNLHRIHQKSFVLINSSLGSDDIPEELAVVPTLTEAIDYIQMEEIERDLG